MKKVILTGFFVILCSAAFAQSNGQNDSKDDNGSTNVNNNPDIGVSTDRNKNIDDQKINTNEKDQPNPAAAEEQRKIDENPVNNQHIETGGTYRKVGGSND